ncbi:agmatine deiminase family protein [bacterium SCSIO 12643]|nr:agmatine deiminase family protein [bacterium SCSIO 12643]
MPEESSPHEGTWLQWPHQYQYGVKYRNDVESSWIDMTKALISSEKVHIIAYNIEEKNRIIDLLQNENISLDQIDFKIYPTDDVWIRDNGPIYVKDLNGNLVIQDWGFNGWGNKADYEKCDLIPRKIAQDQGLESIDLNAQLINEGGSFEIDGDGTLMACKSSILNKNRNPNISQEQVEQLFKMYLGITHFIWLDGQAGLDITDQHIDGFARFVTPQTIVTMDDPDLEHYDVKSTDIQRLYSAKTKDGKSYHYIKIPLTKNNVVTTHGKNLGYKGSYINYYIGNTVVLVPNYNDPNDVIANGLLQDLYPNRQVIGIDVRNLFEFGGMIHCVTQQQPE